MEGSVELSAKPGTDLVEIDKIGLPAAFLSGEVDDILGKIKTASRSVERDISTSKGRDAIKSLAYKIARTKTALDEHGKTLVADWKAKASAIDIERRRIREDLDALKDEIRQPLTDWENAEQARCDAHEAAILALANTASFAVIEPSITEIDGRLGYLDELAARDFQEFLGRAKITEERSRASLTDLREATVKREADRAELARLKAEADERQRQEALRLQQEREAQIAAEAAAKAKREAEAEAERQRIAAEQKAAAERLALEEKARLEREAAASEKAAAEARAAQAEIDRQEAQEWAEEAERARIAATEKAEADRIAAVAKAEQDRFEAGQRAAQAQADAIQSERAAVAQRAADEEAAERRRQANKRHRGFVNGSARDALMKVGISQELATAAVIAIAKGEIPNVTISY